MTPALRSRLLIAGLYGLSAVALLAFLAVQTSFPLRWEWLFFGIAFAGTEVPWVTLAIGDFGVKLLVAAVMLIPFRLLLRMTAPVTAQ